VNDLVSVPCLDQGFNQAREIAPAGQLGDVTMLGGLGHAGPFEAAVKNHDLGRRPALAHVKTEADVIRPDQVEE